jgi:hypothetical protein
MVRELGRLLAVAVLFGACAPAAAPSPAAGSKPAQTTAPAGPATAPPAVPAATAQPAAAPKLDFSGLGRNVREGGPISTPDQEKRRCPPSLWL